MRQALLATLSLALLAAVPAPRPYDFAAARQLVGVGAPQLSPDGSKLIYIHYVADFKHDRGQSTLMICNLATGAKRTLIYDRSGFGGATWSPRGGAIAFTASVKSGNDTQSQLFVMPLAGGDAKQITHMKNGVTSYAWSPDGTRFALISQDANPDRANIAAHRDAFEVGDNDYLHTAATPPLHLWLVSANGGTEKRLTQGAWSAALANPNYGGALSWSADGTRIAFVHFPNAILGDALAATVDTVNVRTGVIARLTGNGGLEGNPRFAPLGDAVAYMRPTHGYVPNGNALYVTRPGGGPGADVRAAIDRNVGGAQWTPDGKALWIETDYGTHNVLWYQPIGGTAFQANLGGRELAGVGNVSRTGAIAVALATANHPADIFVIAGPRSTPKQVTFENGFLRAYALARVTSVNWIGPNGFHEDGVLTYPPRYVRGKRYPLVLLIHGGPQEATSISWDSRRELFAAHGYLVFEPNYRGSDNMGDRYQAAIAHDAGMGPGKDVMAGVAAVQSLGIVDDSRIAVTGWSYGGYMTSWLEGHYHIWKAAMEGAAVDDEVYDYNISFYVHDDEPYFGGSTWDPKYAAEWRDQSPIAYAAQITTPTLIMGDIGDNNVPITNSFQMYHALKDNGVHVEFVAYPVGGHFPGDPVRSENVGKRWLGWLDTYLGGHV